MKNSPVPTIIIMGPTASGKSDLAIVMARKHDGEIISADSRQVYRGMDIGTGKVPRDLTRISNSQFLISKQSKKNIYFSEGIRHHLLDVASPKRSYNVTHFIRDAKKALVEIKKRGKTPIICGGTGFWIQALVEGSTFPTVRPNVVLRKQLGKFSAPELLQKLTRQDPKRAATIDPHNKVRLIRALEIIAALGKVPLLPKSKQPRIRNQDFIIFALNPDQDVLYKNIETRLEKRLKKGMIAEVKKLRAEGLSWKRIENFGLEYKYVALLLQKKISQDTMKERLNFEIRHYAKRQLTWLRRFERMGARIHWIANPTAAFKLLREKIYH